MSGMALVTGGAGFVGSHLVDALLRRGDEVRVFDSVPLSDARNLREARDMRGFRYFQGDVRDRPALERALHPDVSVVYHLASIVGVHRYMDDPFGLIDVTIGGTRNVAEIALERGIRLLYTSTSEVLGKNPNVPWQEDADRVLGSTSVDRWSYATSKAVCEHMLLALHRKRGLPVTIVRYFNAYGPRQAPIFLVSKCVQQVLTGRRPLLYDSGRQTRCLTYIDDEIRGTVLAAEHPAAVGEVFNLGNDREVSVREIVEHVTRAAGSRLEPEPFDTRERYGAAYEDIPRRVPAVDKARRVLAWEARVPHEEGIRRTVEWARAAENAWYLEAGGG